MDDSQIVRCVLQLSLMIRIVSFAVLEKFGDDGRLSLAVLEKFGDGWMIVG